MNDEKRLAAMRTTLHAYTMALNAIIWGANPKRIADAFCKFADAMQSDTAEKAGEES